MTDEDLGRTVICLPSRRTQLYIKVLRVSEADMLPNARLQLKGE